MELEKSIGGVAWFALGPPAWQETGLEGGGGGEDPTDERGLAKP